MTLNARKVEDKSEIFFRRFSLTFHSIFFRVIFTTHENWRRLFHFPLAIFSTLHTTFTWKVSSFLAELHRDHLFTRQCTKVWRNSLTFNWIFGKFSHSSKLYAEFSHERIAKLCWNASEKLKFSSFLKKRAIFQGAGKFTNF